jgi:hypothetical protein
MDVCLPAAARPPQLGCSGVEKYARVAGNRCCGQIVCAGELEDRDEARMIKFVRFKRAPRAQGQARSPPANISSMRFAAGLRPAPIGDPDRRPSRHRPAAFGSTPQEQRALRGCPLGRIQLDVTCARANGAFRAPRSALSQHVLTWLTWACCPRMRNARPGFQVWVQCGRPQLRLHHGFAREGPANEDENARCRLTSRTIIEWASSGHRVGRALMARSDALFGIGLRRLGEMLGNALAPAHDLFGLLAVVLEGGLQILRIDLMHVGE